MFVSCPVSRDHAEPTSLDTAMIPPRGVATCLYTEDVKEMQTTLTHWKSVKKHANGTRLRLMVRKYY